MGSTGKAQQPGPAAQDKRMQGLLLPSALPLAWPDPRALSSLNSTHPRSVHIPLHPPFDWGLFADSAPVFEAHAC